jgi:NAD(P)-dependent dehydrogenase (short-subunit alcohol dehydrogenase family)
MGLKDITDQHFIDMLRVNLVTPTLLIQSLQNQFAVGASLIFFSSVAKKKGSYDPSYASAKAGLSGLMHSICNAMPHVRCNMISLGLVENSPVYNQMTDDFREKHANRMQNKRFIQVKNINSMIELLLNNESINRADMALDGGYT